MSPCLTRAPHVTIPAAQQRRPENQAGGGQEAGSRAPGGGGRLVSVSTAPSPRAARRPLAFPLSALYPGGPAQPCGPETSVREAGQKRPSRGQRPLPGGLT